jgi:hypothetical protein
MTAAATHTASTDRANPCGAGISSRHAAASGDLGNAWAAPRRIKSDERLHAATAPRARQGQRRPSHGGQPLHGAVPPPSECGQLEGAPAALLRPCSGPSVPIERVYARAVTTSFTLLDQSDASAPACPYAKAPGTVNLAERSHGSRPQNWRIEPRPRVPCKRFSQTVDARFRLVRASLDCNSWRFFRKPSMECRMSETPRYRCVERCFVQPVGWSSPRIVEPGETIEVLQAPGMALEPLNAAARATKAASINPRQIDAGAHRMQQRQRMARSLGFAEGAGDSVAARQHIQQFVDREKDNKQ